jgi:hypothetical protein
MNIFNKFLLLSFLSLLSIQSYAQKGTGCKDDLVPKISENRNWGYADLFGQWIIEPIYSKVSPFVEGKAIVQRGNLCGVIDCEGNVILQCKYERLANFRNGKAWAQEKGLWGLVGAKGQVFQSAQFTDINPIVNTEFAWVRKNNVWGLFNEDKNMFVCQPQYKVAQVMSMEASLVQTEKNYGVINHSNCSYLIPLELTKVKKIAENDIIFQKNNLWGVFNDAGKVLINADFDTIVLKNKELLQVTKAGKKGFYGLRGKKILPVEYDEIGELSEVYYLVKQNGKYGYCSRSGKVYIKPMYDDAAPFKNKQAAVKKGEKWGIIDYTNKFLLKPEFDHIAAGKGNFYAMTQGDKVYFYDTNMKKITEESFEKIFVGDTAYAVRVKKEGKFSYYNPAAKSYVTTEKFEMAMPYEKGFAAVANGGKRGLLDVNGKMILPCEYDNIVYDQLQSKIVFRTLQNGKEGMTDATGKVIIPNEYEQLMPALPNYIKAKKNGKYGIIRTSGATVTEFIYDYMGNSVDIPDAPEWPAMVSLKGKYGLINEKGEEVFPIKAKELSYIGNRLYVAKEGKSLVLVNNLGKITEIRYDQVNYIGDGMAAVKTGDKWGYMLPSGEEKIKPLYEQAELFYNKLAAVKLKGKWGMIDRSGKMVIAAEYDDYKEDKQGNRKLYKAGKEYVLQPDGSIK